MIEKERRYNKFREYLANIEEQELIIKEAKQKIFEIGKEKDAFHKSCTHTFDDGSTAFKNTSYWVSDSYTYTDDWTGEEMQGDNGYTQYEKTCQICDKEEEY